MRGFTQNRQIGTALPLAVMNRIRRQNGGYARGYQELSSSLPGWQSLLQPVGQLARLYIYASSRLG